MRFFIFAAALAISGCETSIATGVHSYNGSTAEIELYGDTFAYGTPEQKQAQIDAAKIKAEQACGGDAKFLDRRMDHQPQNGVYYVAAKNIAIFKCA